MAERSTGLNDYEITNGTTISRAANALNNDVVLLCSRYEQALDVLEQWVEEHPGDRALALRTRALLRRGGRVSAAVVPPVVHEQTQESHDG